MTGVIDYGAGNLGSVMNALARVGAPARFVRGPEELESKNSGLDKIIFPGDGHFGSAMAALAQSGYDTAIKHWISLEKPFLGICIGLQLLFESSEEAPGVAGLGVLTGGARLFKAKKVPQIGWNRTRIDVKNPFFSGLEENPFFYYIHSYYVVPKNRQEIAASADYDVEFCAAVKCGSVFAVQFHPEKSGDAGLALLKNWTDFH
ncbi:MAG: imidazole glycerol phosphate synthase subunit HisH [Spirochaetaceae bacterium]|jgi:imidazole glycerol phosphate synthase glutamine amidotransferase subunit|nr:imidazole glycerol phosphate synthase subunit HisH [Spirochaetaceae bacterium]